MERDKPAFLGQGWAFPPRFDLPGRGGAGAAPGAAGSVALVSDDADIEESLRLIFLTRPGERIMRPEFGAGLQAHVFDPADPGALGHIRDVIEDAILHFEPRIKLEALDIDTSRAADGVMALHLTYWVPAINSRSNKVFPFYVREGTNLHEA
ncbi:GPW/gp25 family protein [Pseudaestuariivita atlantica]|uniref:IraD/Gp25-like domain-containing protein n=1 Tax=Pseudaestuariivita atlantica TaxID=1317121 RepID=A0A0L1JMT2_9RHOB|nr:GPW/gp25 family protein [Pseudaestuariivita atlantica]KNG93065.1 hypothetical protein ATO11_14195 [Pseudaestuariivita atlantica]